MNRKIVNFSMFVFLIALLIFSISNMTYKYGANFEQIDSNMQWEFFHEVWINPDEADQYWGNGQPISIPHKFKDEFNTSETFGTYITKIILPTEFINKKLGIFILFEYGSYDLFINNELVLSSGLLSSNKEGYKLSVGPKMEHYKTDKSEIYVTMHLSNYSSIRGGFAIPIQIGDYDLMLKKYNQSLVFHFFIIGIIFTIGIFLFQISLLYKRRNSAVLLAGICLAIAVRSVFSRPFFYSITTINIPWGWAVKIEATTTIIILILFIQLCRNIIQPFMKSKFYIFPYIVISLQGIITIFTTPMIFQQTFFYFFLLHLCYIPYSFYLFIRNYNAISKERKLQFFAIILFACAAIHDVLVVYYFLDQPMIIHLITILFALIQIVVISQNYEDKLKLAHTDKLTGISNRYVFDTNLAYYFKKTKEPNNSLTLIMIDLDYFKQYNDFYGHQAGDELLGKIVKGIKEILPLCAVFCRYGGEEFAILINDESIDYDNLCNKVVKCVEEKRIPHRFCENGFSTISLGAYQIFYGHKFKTPSDLVIAADSQLYKAKKLGRNMYQFVSIRK